MKRIRRVIGLCSITLGTVTLALGSVPGAVSGQGGPGTENGEWRYLGGDAWHTRYSVSYTHLTLPTIYSV